MISGLKYTPPSLLFLTIPSISKIQWHPFSLTSSSSTDEHTISNIIRSDGEWTNSLFNKICVEADAEADQRECIPAALEGPYGPATLDFLRYQLHWQNKVDIEPSNLNLFKPQNSEAPRFTCYDR